VNEMYQEERMRLILEHLQKNKRISVEEICSLYQVSRDTARRDIVNLAKQGLIIRTHGGAILPTLHEEAKPYSERLQRDREEKQKIAKYGASLINEGDTVILDTSTTVQACTELFADKPCTVITNSINIADTLSKKSAITILLLGGRLNHDHLFLYGTATTNMLSDYFADRAFIGALAVSAHGVTVDDDEDAAIMRKMIHQSKEVVVLADHTKFNKTAFVKVCDLSAIDLLITDLQPTASFMEILKQNNVSLIIAE
jgi:DeoR family transcriptional regulator, carbon catabolite repression regulator